LLEDELHRLYSLLTQADELRGLQHENEILKDIMIRHSIPLPPNILSHRTGMAEVIIIGDTDSQQYLQVRLPDYECESNYFNNLSAPPYADESKDQDPQLSLEQSNKSPDTRYTKQMGTHSRLNIT
jgi:hypothetical protein